MKRYAFGVDLGGTTCKIGLFGEDKTILEKWEIKSRKENGGENILPDISAQLLGKLRERGISHGEVQGAGLAVPGAVREGSFVVPCVNLNWWGGFDAAKALHDLTGFNVRVANDANAAAFGEMFAGSALGRKNVVFVTLGTGVGGGIIVDGKIVEGFHGAAGEIGHIKIAEESDMLCGCGKSGCLEQFASATGILRRAKEWLASCDAPSAMRDAGELECKDIYDCAKAGDMAALKIVDDTNKALGRTLAGISCVCDPEIILFGGGVSKAGDIITEGVGKYFKKYAFPAAEETEFAISKLKNDAGMYGAMALVRRMKHEN